jgi:hypothetical protein
MKHLTLIGILLFASAASVAQNYSNASVTGNYSIQITNPSAVTWSKLWTCTVENKKAWYTVTGGTTVQNLSYGVASFDGAGNVTSTITLVGEVNAAASGNTTSVQWDSNCNVVSTKPGYAVYYAPANKTYTGTYSVQSTGSGSMNIGGQSFNLVLAGANVSGTSTTLLINSQQQNAAVILSGIAVLQ